MKIESKPGVAKVIHEKRCYVPVVLRGTCPACGGEFSRDFDDQYLSEPPCGVPFKEGMWCPRCDHEWTEMLQLDVTLRVLAQSEDK